MKSGGNRPRLRFTCWFKRAVLTPYSAAKSASMSTRWPRTFWIRATISAGSVSVPVLTGRRMPVKCAHGNRPISRDSGEMRYADATCPMPSDVADVLEKPRDPGRLSSDDEPDCSECRQPQCLLMSSGLPCLRLPGVLPYMEATTAGAMHLRCCQRATLETDSSNSGRPVA